MLNPLMGKSGHARALRKALRKRSKGTCEHCHTRRALLCRLCHNAAHGNVRNLNREAELIMLYRSGATLQEIGDAIGVSRERVRQIMARAGEETRRNSISYVDPLKVLQAVEGSKSLKEIAKKAGCGLHGAGKVLRSMGVPIPKISRRKYSDKQLTDHMKKVARMLGRTPNMHDLNTCGITHTTYVNRYGSVRRAQEAAGLRPNAVGGAGHRRSTAHA